MKWLIVSSVPFTAHISLKTHTHACLRLGANTRVRRVVQSAVVSAATGDEDTAATAASAASAATAALAQSVITSMTTTTTTTTAVAAVPVAAGRHFHQVPVRGEKAIAVRSQHSVQPLAHASLNLDALRHFELGVGREQRGGVVMSGGGGGGGGGGG